MPTPQNDIEVRSDEVQEIMSHVPYWMIRWGVTLIFLLLILFLFLSWLIKYPDIISGTATINTEVPGIKLVNKHSGEIEVITVTDNETIQAGDIVAVINNPLSQNAKKELDSVLVLIKDAFYQTGTNFLEFNPPKVKNTFGDLQNSYSNLIGFIQEYNQLFSDKNWSFKIKYLNDQIHHHKILRSVTYQMLSTSKDQFRKAKEKLESDQVLFEKEVISKMEFYEREKAFFLSKSEMEQLKKASIQHSITISDLEKQLNQIEYDLETEKEKLNLKIEEELLSIQNELNNWSSNYEIIAPTSGQLTYLLPLHQNQYIEQGKELFAILPEKDQYKAELKIPQTGYGKVEKGQVVRIKLDNFPHQEFGQIEGVVEQIALIPNEKEYLITVDLPNGLKSSYNKDLAFTPEMSGSADIITKDKRLLQRVFNQFESLFDQ